MSESRPKKRKIEFIESYWTGDELGGDYQWNDNHGELIRCKDCKYMEKFEDGDDYDLIWCSLHEFGRGIMYYCADGERKEPE